jgi:hypothetical protein
MSKAARRNPTQSESEFVNGRFLLGYKAQTGGQADAALLDAVHF